jgi:hypothetical protein
MMGKSIAAQERENAHMNMVEGPNGQYRPEGMQYEGAPLAGVATGLSAQSGGEGAGMHGQTEPKAEFVQAEGTTRARSEEDERASEWATESHLADPGAEQRDARVPETGTLTSGIVSAQVVTGGLDATLEAVGPLQEDGPEAAARALEHLVQNSSETEKSADE